MRARKAEASGDASLGILLALGDDIQKVTGGEKLVHELVVVDQGEHSLVLVGQQALFDMQVTRSCDDHDVLVVGRVRLPVDLVCRRVAAACEIGPRLLNGREDLIGDVRAVEGAARPGAAIVEHEYDFHGMRCAHIRIAAWIRPVVAERVVERALHIELIKHGNPEHELVDELRLDKSRLLEPADPVKFVVILPVLFLQVGDCVAHSALGEFLLLFHAQHRALTHEQPGLVGCAAGHDGYVLCIAFFIQLDGRLGEHLRSVIGAGRELADRFDIRLLERLFRQRHDVVHGLAAGVLQQCLRLALRGFAADREGQGGRAALGDDFLEILVRLLHDRQDGDRTAAGALPEDGHVAGVAAESGDVLVHPPERHSLVEQAVAGRRLEVFTAGHRGEVHEAVHIQTVVDVHHDDVAMRLDEVGSAVAGLAARAVDVGPAVDPYHHRLLLGLVVGVDPDVQVEAVFRGQRLNVITTLALAVTSLSVVPGLEDPVAFIHVFRSLEAAHAHGRLREGDAQPRRDPVLLGTDEGAVHALHGMSLVVVSRDFAVQAFVIVRRV